MIKNLLISTVLVLGFSSISQAHDHGKEGMKKANEAKATVEKDKKADADAALNKVKKMTDEARAKATDTKDKKKTK